MATYSHQIANVRQYQYKGSAVVRCRVFDKGGFVRWSIETANGEIVMDFGCFVDPHAAISDLRRNLGAPPNPEGDEALRRHAHRRHRPDLDY